MDELAIACGLDPVELRIRNEPEVDPESGRPFSSRNLVACLREGARRFGWENRDPTPRSRRQDGWLVGTGVASSTYPVNRMPGSTATIRAGSDGRFTITIGAADIGTGTWTTLTQIAADALQVPVDRIEMHIGDTSLPFATVAGGSSGMTCWGSALVEAAGKLRACLDRDHAGLAPPEGVEATGHLPDNPWQEQYAMHAFGAQFAEVRVHEDTGEVRAPRLLGVFAAGRIINAKTGRSQFLGGMTMGLSMALHENSVVDPRYGHVANHDFAEYHIATNADVGAVDPTGSTRRTPTSTQWGPRASGRSAFAAPRRRWPMPPTMPPVSGSGSCPSPWTSSCRNLWRGQRRRPHAAFRLRIWTPG